jgi:hypothetical protein
MKATFTFISSLLFFLTAYAQDQGVIFRLRDSKTGYGVNAQVIIENRITHQKEYLPTDKNGQISFHGNGEFTYQVIADNYKSLDSYFTLSNSISLLNIEILLTPNSIPILPTTENNKTVVQGYVVEPYTGTPIEAVSIQLKNLSISTQTDSRGFYKFELENDSDFNTPNFKPIRHSVSFSKNGFKELHIENYIFFQGNLNFNVNLVEGEGVEIEQYKHGLFDRNESDTENQVLVNNPPPNNPNEVLACTVPSSIRVGTSCSCTTCSTITTMSLEEYVQKGLDDEWIASWNSASLSAGAVAYRTYGAYFVNNPVNSNFDIASTTCNQVFNGSTFSTSCSNAAQATVGGMMVSSSGNIVKCEYSAENNGKASCGTTGFTGDGVAPWTCKSDAVCAGQATSGHGRGMCQWGSKRWGDPAQNKSYTWILDNYYSRANWTLCTGTALPPPSNDNCPGTTLTSTTSCSNTTGTVTGATASGRSKSSCDTYAGTPALLDVWYSFTAINTTHTINIRPIGTIDAVVSVYSNCSTPLTNGCKDDSGVGSITNFNVTGLTVGNTYYIRVYDYGITAPVNGSFNICVTHQASTPCTTTISASSRNFSSDGGSGSFNVSMSPIICTYSATSSCSWVTLNSSSGSGGGAITYSVAQNPSTTSRNCTITVNGQTHTISQSGAQPCTYSFSPTGNTYTFDEQIGKLNVTANAGCDWIATTNNSWITVLTPSGAGSAEVSFRISKNTAPNEQIGTVKISGRSPNSTYESYFNVVQSGLPVQCTYAISPTSQNLPSMAGSGSVNLTTTSATCAWTASTNCNWVTLANASGSGSSTISYTVSANTTTASRTCTITVNGQTHTITQSGISCTYSINSSSQSFASTGGTGNFNLTSPTGCTWTASTNCNWVTLANASGSGSSTISYTVSANTTTASRTCTITVNGQTHTITQGSISCTYSISSSSQSFTSTGGTGNFNLTSPTGCTWTASTNCNWVTLANASGSGSSTISYTVSANTTTASRTCTITVNGQSYVINQTVSNAQCDIVTPIIIAGNCDLRIDAQADCSYQWQKNGIDTGTNSRFLTIRSSGFYTCKVTKTTNSTCAKQSKDLYVSVTSGNCNIVKTEDLLSLQNLLLYPNPNHGSFIIEFELSKLTNVGIKVYNSVGQQVYVNDKNVYIGKYKQQVNLIDKISGIYFVVIDIDDEKITKNVVIH